MEGQEVIVSIMERIIRVTSLVYMKGLEMEDSFCTFTFLSLVTTFVFSIQWSIPDIVQTYLWWPHN